MSDRDGPSDLLELAEIQATRAATEAKLEDGSAVAVIGGGPAGSFVSYFLLDMAERLGIDLQVDLYEPRNFTRPGPASCNHCGGIVSESLVQLLAAEGINLPTSVVQRGIDSYVLHMGVGTVRIETPLGERRIAAIHRGAGPRGVEVHKWSSFDGFLQTLALDKGTRLLAERVNGLSWDDGRPRVSVRSGEARTYDLLVGAVGVNTNVLKHFESLDIGYRTPETTKAYICEIPLGEDTVHACLGNAMHVFLLDLPRLEFAALIPKGEFATVCLLGEDIDKNLVTTFLETPDVQACLPPNWKMPETYCHCSPMINIKGAAQPFGDRVVMIGDSGVTRLYKDGIGAAYRTAKAAATTAVFHGISAQDFRLHYLPVTRSIAADNSIGKFIFAISRQLQKRGLGRRALLRMVSAEQKKAGGSRRMSMVMWDTFTGSAPYRDIFRRSLHPSFLGGLAWHGAAAVGGAILRLFRRDGRGSVARKPTQERVRRGYRVRRWREEEMKCEGRKR